MGLLGHQVTTAHHLSVSAANIVTRSKLFYWLEAEGGKEIILLYV